jgi:rhodanese-related sulfurtransferase/glutaredoxin
MDQIQTILKKIPSAVYASAVVVAIIAGFITMLILLRNDSDSPEVQGVSTVSAEGETRVRIYEFWGEGCPHCTKANDFLKKYIEETEGVELHAYEVWKNEENALKYENVAKALGQEPGGVPFIIVGDKTFYGFDNEDGIGREISEQVDYCKENTCEDTPGKVLGVIEEESTDTNQVKHVNVQEANMIIEENKSNENFVLLDIRTPEETATGIISGAETLDFYADNFSQEVDKLDKNKTYFIYCRSGNRSAATADIMKLKRFTNIYNMEGGINDWVSNGYPIE